MTPVLAGMRVDFPKGARRFLLVERKLHGHFNYFHVNDNWEMLMKYREAARRLAVRWMRRRSHKGGQLSWESYQLYLDRHPLALPGRLKDLIAMGRTT